MQASVTHILPLTTIQRERVLPAPGKVVVRKGQSVSPRDIIAEVMLNPEHLMLDVARGLGLSAAKADRYIQIRAEDLVGEGDILAGPVGMAKRVVRAPRQSKVVAVGNGQILLEVETRPFELKAGFSGIVTDLLPDLGAVIETTGALIQGVWGNGQVDFGLLHSVLNSPEETVKVQALDLSIRGAIVLAGSCNDEAVLKTAAEIPLRGLILSSMTADLIPLAGRMPYPIILVEGFGLLPMALPAFKLLSTSVKREVALNAEPWDRYAGTRPEIIISLPQMNESTPPAEVDDFKINQSVRLIGARQRGATGVIANLLGQVVFPSGLRAPAARVQLENSKEEIVAALANLEILV